MKPRILAMFAILALFASFLHADGKLAVTAAPTAWKVQAITFSLAGPAAFVKVQNFKADSTPNGSPTEYSMTGEKYDALLFAVNTPSGKDEATLTKDDGSPDLAAIFLLRISRFVVAQGYLPIGATAEPVSPYGKVVNAPVKVAPPK